jgi:hypothetical protein
MSEKLKPCPFCGCEYTKDDDDYWWAGEHEHGCPLSASFRGGGCNVTVFDEKEDIDAWNRRVVDADTPCGAWKVFWTNFKSRRVNDEQ